MLKYLTVALLALAPALFAFGATPAAEQGGSALPSSAHKTSTHGPTAAQRRAKLQRAEHARAGKRTAPKRRLTRRTGKRHRAAKRHSTVAHRTVKRRGRAHGTLAQRRAAHRAYERHLAHERWLRRHRAYEARLRRARAARHRAYARRLAARRALRRRAEEARAGKARGASHPHDGTEVAKADVLQPGPTPGQGTALDYVSHAHVRLYWRSPLRGTHASLVRQNERDRAEGLTRIRDEAQLAALVRGRHLVPLPLNNDLQADPRLERDRRYTRPWTAHFLRDVGRAFAHRFGDPLVITSAVRPASYQRRLTWRNGNAAPANGVIASPHEYGATIDIGKKGMTAREMAWMRGYLLPIQKAGQIDVEEEFHQACFHVTVYTNYVPAPRMRRPPEGAGGGVEADAR